MKPEQLALDFAAPATTGPDRARLFNLVTILRETGSWITRRQLETIGFDERELRELCEHDDDGCVFSYPGSPGYKHFDLVTDEEFDRCVALKTQGEKMTQKWLRYQRRWHRRFKTRGTANAVG